MKVSIFVALVVLLPFLNSYGQNLRINIGPILGMNTYSVRTDIDHSDQIPGGNFSGGAYGRLSVNNIYFQPEILYTNRSTTLVGAQGQAAQYIKYRGKSWDINIIGGYKFTILNLFNLRALTGITVVNNYKQSLKIDGENFPTGKIKDNYVCRMLGIGIDALQFTIDLRHERTFGDILRGDGKIKDRYFYFCIGYKFF